MGQKLCRKIILCITWIPLSFFLVAGSISHGQDEGGEPQGPPPVPVRVASVIQDTVSEQTTLVGTTEPIARSRIASEISGLVEEFPVREGDFVKKGQTIVRLRSSDLELRLKSAIAAREKVRANLRFAEKELERYTTLKDADSIAARKYDEALYMHQSLKQELVQTEADIALLEDDIKKKTVLAPFAGFVAEEHTEVGEWLPLGDSRGVVTLVDMEHVRITVDVPERYAVQLVPESPVQVLVASLSNELSVGKISAILPEGDPNARTFPVRVNLANPDLKIRSGMEAKVTFSLRTTTDALLVPKDAIVTAGANRLVYVVASTVAQPVNVQVIGYHDGNVAVEGALKPEDLVVVRGNERLRPGQAVEVIE